MKTAALFFCVLIWTSFVSAQESPNGPSVPPLPEGLLVNRAPEFAKWTITTQADASTGGSTKDAPKEPPRFVTYIKTGKIFAEMDGHLQTWHLGEIELCWMGDNSPPYLSSSPGDFYNVDLSKSDFPGLDWVTPQAYTGIVPINGRKCMVFQGQVNPKPSSELSIIHTQERDLAAYTAYQEAKKTGQPGTVVNYKPDDSKFLVPAVIYIDLETRLPVMMKFGKEKKYTRTYAFQAPPSSLLVPPPQISGAIKDQKASLDRLARVPAAP